MCTKQVDSQLQVATDLGSEKRGDRFVKKKKLTDSTVAAIAFDADQASKLLNRFAASFEELWDLETKKYA